MLHVADAEPFLVAAAKAMAIDTLHQIDTGLDPVTAEREQWDDGNNTLALAPRVAVAYERNDETNARLEEAGIEVVRIAGSELGSGRGGPRCMSCPISRAPLPVGRNGRAVASTDTASAKTTAATTSAGRRPTWSANNPASGATTTTTARLNDRIVVLTRACKASGVMPLAVAHLVGVAEPHPPSVAQRARPQHGGGRPIQSCRARPRP